MAIAKIKLKNKINYLNNFLEISYLKFCINYRQHKRRQFNRKQLLPAKI